ncbi:exosortase [Anaerobaca lacustris]|uniref:Exosortase n=1 Tax=Anaerobaca lacustris TaxID=3044600 RepID=A0AAW6U0T2_9BACT|nr:exosortase [Sedimentisphaerales bacterium M17dextr]
MEENLLLEKLDIRTVVLVGRQDFGRCPLGTRLPAALWPIAGKPALERLLDHLADEGIRSAVVCCESDVSAYVEPVCRGGRLEVAVVTEDLTGGTAGCLRDAVGSDPGDLIVVFSGGIALPPPLRSLVESHCADGSDMTVAFNPGRLDASAPGSPAEIYLCKPDVLRLIPAGGYSDIKEGLIPSILRAGGVVRPVVLPRDVGSFHDRAGYLHAVSMHLAQNVGCADDPMGCEGSPIASQGSIHPSARVFGAVEIGEDAEIAQGAVVVGPAVIGPRAVVGRDSVVVRSVLWDAAQTGHRCELFESVLDGGAVLPDRAVVRERTVVSERPNGSAGQGPAHRRDAWRRMGERISERVESVTNGLPAWARLSAKEMGYLAGGAAILAALLWSYWPTFVDLYGIWRRNDEYSAGLLVPVLAAYIIWSWRRDLERVPVRPAVVAGIIVFVMAQVIRGLGLFLMFRSAERLSIILSVVAITLLLLGWAFLRKLAPAWLFLCLMLPWPNRAQAALALPLQRWATTSAVFCLELVGYEVGRDGNIITIGDTTVAVAEACNGLRMITAFIVISALVVLLVRRPWWEKLLVLLSSLPIALLCNTLRLTATAVAFMYFKGEHVEKAFHDFGGYAMMPLALAMVVGELWFLRRLTTPPSVVSPTVIARREPRQMPQS